MSAEGTPTGNDGKAFEARVRDALIDVGYIVRPEQLMGTKRVDLLARTRRWAQDWLVAVECKDEVRALSKARLATLWAEYEPLYAMAQVQELLVVTARVASPAAIAWAESRPGLSLQTMSELLASAMDL